MPAYWSKRTFNGVEYDMWYKLTRDTEVLEVYRNRGMLGTILIGRFKQTRRDGKRQIPAQGRSLKQLRVWEAAMDSALAFAIDKHIEHCYELMEKRLICRCCGK